MGQFLSHFAINILKRFLNTLYQTPRNNSLDDRCAFGYYFCYNKSKVDVIIATSATQWTLCMCLLSLSLSACVAVSKSPGSFLTSRNSKRTQCTRVNFTRLCSKAKNQFNKSFRDESKSLVFSTAREKKLNATRDALYQLSKIYETNVTSRSNRFRLSPGRQTKKKEKKWFIHTTHWKWFLFLGKNIVFQKVSRGQIWNYISSCVCVCVCNGLNTLKRKLLFFKKIGITWPVDISLTEKQRERERKERNFCFKRRNEEQGRLMGLII